VRPVVALAALLMLSLNGCGQTKTAVLAECQVDTDKVFPRGPDAERHLHMAACMAVRNYEWSLFVSPTSTLMCAPDAGLSYYQAVCYHRVGAWTRLTDH
jgi:hypothetical protein